MAQRPLEPIEHVVVLMLENRSLNNVLGWLYADEGNQPPRNWPPPSPGQPTTYNGLKRGSGSNANIDPRFFNLNKAGERVYAQRVPDGNLVAPKPGPEEAYARMTAQMFGPQWSKSKGSPPKGATYDMSGFVEDYEASLPFWDGDSDAEQIMWCYGPEQLSVLNGLARAYGVSDAWFASTPTQTNPNRAFATCGTSLGKVNNTLTQTFDVPTIYNVLADHDVSWKVYYQGHWLLHHCYTEFTFPRLNGFEPDRFPKLEQLAVDVANDTLPAYSFIEPSWFMLLADIGFNGNDYHSYGDLRPGEAMVKQVYDVLKSNPAVWQKTLFIITFDEHGGCWDHVAPPWTAVPPDEFVGHNAEFGFGFDRFGARVPTLLVSPWIPSGTVFRAPGNIPFDHTSILNTVLRWQGIDPATAGLGKRVAQAPGFEGVLSGSPRTDVPEVTVAAGEAWEPTDLPDETPIAEHQLGFAGLLAANIAGVHRRHQHDAIIEDLHQLRTVGELRRFMADRLRESTRPSTTQRENP